MMMDHALRVGYLSNLIWSPLASIPRSKNCVEQARGTLELDA
jgi:hypothetical protein